MRILRASGCVRKQSVALRESGRALSLSLGPTGSMRQLADERPSFRHGSTPPCLRVGLGANRPTHATSLRRRLCNRHRRTVADRDGACVRRRGVRGSSNLRTKSSTPRCVWSQSSCRCARNRLTCPSARLGRVHGSRRRCSRIFADDGRGWRRSCLGSQMAPSSPRNPTTSRHPVTITFGDYRAQMQGLVPFQAALSPNPSGGGPLIARQIDGETEVSADPSL
jgi:hypothetical protein